VRVVHRDVDLNVMLMSTRILFNVLHRLQRPRGSVLVGVIPAEIGPVAGVPEDDQLGTLGGSGWAAAVSLAASGRVVSGSDVVVSGPLVRHAPSRRHRRPSAQMLPMSMERRRGIGPTGGSYQLPRITMHSTNRSESVLNASLDRRKFRLRGRNEPVLLGKRFL